MSRDYCYTHGNGVYPVDSCPECATVGMASDLDQLREQLRTMQETLDAIFEVVSDLRSGDKSGFAR